MTNKFAAYQLIEKIGPVTYSEFKEAAELAAPGSSKKLCRAIEKLSEELLITHGPRRFCRVTQAHRKTWQIKPVETGVES